MANKRFIVRHGLDNSGDNSVVNTIINVAEPVNNSDAATKYYVDTHTTGGTVTSVTATSPVESTGGTTPVISLGTGANGQLVIGTGTGFTKSTLTAGTGVSIANASGSITISATGSGGDVVGPASATDNAVTRFDSTTGKLIQNSTVTLDDNGNFGNVNSVVLDNTPATLPTGAGTMYWEDGEGTAEVILKGGNTTLKVGTQEYARVYNDSGSTITLGQVVYISGAQGNRIAVKLAQADVEANSFGTLGLVAETIANGAEGWVIVSGALYKLNTNGLTAGAVVYLSPTTAGAYTTTKPQAPDQLVVLGFVERVSSTVGSIYVKVDNGYELDELHDVRITSPVSGNTLIYDATTSPTGVWKNASLTAGTGISVTNGAGSITIGNTGVTSVSGTSPVVSSGGATPAISLASGYGDTQNPYGSKTANYFLASPNGSAGVPTWRSIVAADIPTLNQNTTGNAATASALQTARNINGVSFNGTADITVTAAASTLTGTTLASGVTASSLTSVGTITTGTWNASAIGVAYGGTGLTTLTAGYIPYGNGTSAFGSSANLFWDSANSRLGIANTTPAYKLDVNGTINGSTYYSNTVALAVTSGSYNLFYRQDGGVGIYLGGADPANYYDNTAHIWRDRAGSEGMRLNSTGLGIGTSSPISKLHVYTAATNKLTLDSPTANDNRLDFAKVGTVKWSMYSPANSNDLRMYDHQTVGDVVTFQSGGNIGLGTSSPGYKLTVAGTSGSAVVSLLETGVRSWGIRAGGLATNTFDIADFTAGASRFSIDSSGNVGIGKTPSYKLDVNGTINGTTFYSNGYTLAQQSSSYIQLFRQDGGIGIFLGGADPANYYDNLAHIFRDRSGGEWARINSTGLGIGTSSPSTKLHVANGGSNAQATFVGTTGSPYITVVANSGTTILGNESNGGWVGTTGSQAFVFKTNDTERMRIDSSGNVGIGTTATTPKLNVALGTGYSTGASWGTNVATFGQATGVAGGALALSFDTSSGSILTSVNPGVSWYPITLSGSENIFKCNAAEQMRLNSTGLGIGTSSPATKLHVIGDIRASGVYVGNGSSGSYTKGFGGVQTTTSTSTPTGGSSGDFTLIY